MGATIGTRLLTWLRGELVGARRATVTAITG